MYVIEDRQIPGRLFADGVTFKTKEEIVDQLADYHSIDFSGCLENNDKRTIFQYLKSFKTVQKKLDFLLNYGQWSIKKITKREREI